MFEAKEVGLAPIKMEVKGLSFIFLKFWDSCLELGGFNWQAGVGSFFFGVMALAPLEPKRSAAGGEEHRDHQLNREVACQREVIRKNFYRISLRY